MIAAGVSLAVGWMWLRDSSLVAIDDVTVTGLTGTEAHQVRRAIEDAARDMTTLHIRHDALDTAVAPYPVVKRLELHTSFPHGLRVVVHENVPVASILVRGRHTPVAADGMILEGAPAHGVPVVPLRTPQGGDRVTDPRAVGAIALLAAAPPQLRARVAQVVTGEHGLTATLRHGPRLFFGPAERLVAKWIAAARVLADSAGATYIDVRVPERPAAGGLEQIAEQAPVTTDPAAVTPAADPAVSAQTATNPQP
jgi:cell division protein FtsQ